MKMQDYFRFNILLIICVVCLLCSCADTNVAVENVSIDFQSIKEFDIEKQNMINIETTDSCLLYTIDAIHFLSNKFVVFSRGKVVVFSYKGEFLFNIGNKGEGSNEYRRIAGMFVRDNKICIYDNVSRRVLSYNENGKYVSQSGINSLNGLIPVSLYHLSDGRFLAKNTFQGGSNMTPEFSLLSSNLDYELNIKGRKLDTGFTFPDDLFQYKDIVLYCPPLNDTIFSVLHKGSVLPRYFVDFKEHAIPSAIRQGKDVYDLIEYSNKPENVMKVASLIRNVHEDDDFLRFMFVFNRNIYYTKYNKVDKKALTYCLRDKSGAFMVNPFVKYHNGLVYISVSSMNNMVINPSLVVVNDSIF